jgi:hypothetical protein
MRFLATLGLIGCCLFAFVLFSSPGIGQEPPSPEPTPALQLELPPDVTLAILATRRKHTCDIINGKAVNHRDGPPFRADLQEVMRKVLALTPTSLDAAAASPNATPCLKSLCVFLKKTNGPNDIVEAVIRANCKEKLYKNCDIINAAVLKCSPERVAHWRQAYPDND